MRTKTLLLSAAALAAGVATSMAANVYSVNVVGYVNVTVAPGYNLLANPLDVDGIDNVQTVLPTLPDGTQMLQWSTSAANFAPVIQYYAGLGWYDASLNPATNDIPPGGGFFLNNVSGAPASVTFVGTVVQGTNHQTVSGGYSFLGSIPPIASDLDTNGFPAQDGMQYFTFASGNYTPVVQYYGGLGWYDSGLNQQFPTPAVAQGFVIFNPTSTSYTWTSTFTVQ